MKAVYYYTGAIILFYVLYISTLFGYKINANYIRSLSTIIQVAVGIYLAVRFFPFQKYKFEEGDASIIFGCAMFLLANVGFTEYILNTFENNVVGGGKIPHPPQDVAGKNAVDDTINTIYNGGASAAAAAAKSAAASAAH